MDTPLTALATYKTMKLASPSTGLNISRRKKLKAKNRKAQSALAMNGAGNSEETNELMGNDKGTSSDGRLLKKRKKKSKNRLNKKVKFVKLAIVTPEEASSSGSQALVHNNKLYPADESDEDLFASENDSQEELVNGTSEGAGSILASSSQKSKKKKKSKKSQVESCVFDSVKKGEDVFKWMLSHSVEDFMCSIWEKEPIHISRHTPNYYSSLISTPEIDQMLRNNNILFGKNLDITSYVDGERETHNQIGRAMPHVVWDFYKNKCSIRLLNPQTYIRNLHTINAMLQEYFGCFVGANAYLTPPDSQGFAPHFDDIEAFILQIEGEKKWKVYKPRIPNEELPRFSSRNLTEDELEDPVLEVKLKAGDLLYFPRGYIHQGSTVPGKHSLHITISVYQRNSFADLLEKMIPAALNNAIKTDVDFRRGLPLNMINQFGLSHEDSMSEEKQQTADKLKSLLHRLVDHIDIDSAVDSIATSFMHDALPPVLSSDELTYSVDSGLCMTDNGIVVNRVQLDPSCSIKLIRLHCCRLVRELGEPDENDLRELEMRLYYSLENSLEYHGNEPQFLLIPENLEDLAKTIIRSYPEFVKIEDLAHDDEDEKLQFLTDLWERGLLRTKEPLAPIQSDDE